VPTFRSWADEYIEGYAKPNKRSWKTDKAYVEANMKLFFGDKLLSSITAFDIGKYKQARLADGVSQRTVNRCLQILRRMFNLAIRAGHMKANPIESGTLYQESGGSQGRVLDYEEEQQLLSVLPPHLKPIVIVALETGLRKGEILALRWTDVDWQNHTMRVRRLKKRRECIDVIPLSSTVLACLRVLKAKAGDSEGYIFANPKTGRPFVEIGKAFRASCRRAGIKNFRLHDTRHTFASRHDRNGTGTATLREMLGHSSSRMLDFYRHSDPELMRRAIEVEEARKREWLARQGHTDRPEEIPAFVSPSFSEN
jgi:integrase